MHTPLLYDLKPLTRQTEDNKLGKGEIGMNELHCEFASTKMGESVTVNSFELPPDFKIVKLYLELELEDPNPKSVEISSTQLAKKLQTIYNRQIKGQQYIPNIMFSKEKDIEEIEQKLMSIGVGGMSTFLDRIYKEVISPRLHLKMKLPRVKGILLHGPPGTGKTLLARSLAELLHANEPTVVNGPSLLAKWTGSSEQNVRELFTKAKKDFKDHGENSPLHVIILDEIDSIAQIRGRNPGDTAGDKVVSQLLTEIDGIEERNNILVVGTTNRKDLIDDALLRSGRLELHIEIGLPDAASRYKILKVHTDKAAKDMVMLQPDVDLQEIASLTAGRTGANLAAVVRTAVLHAANRMMRKKEKTVEVGQNDYIYGVDVICLAPEKGVLETLEKYRSAAKLEVLDGVIEGLDQVAKKIEESKEQLLVTCLLFGSVGCGKTTSAAFVPRNNTFKHVNLVSPNSMIEFCETEKVAKLVQIFEEASRFTSSLIILDDIERLVEYNALQRTCSTLIVNTLLIKLKETPKNTKMLVVGTTSNKEALEEMGICNLFSLKIEIPERKQEADQKMLKEHMQTVSDAIPEPPKSEKGIKRKREDGFKSSNKRREDL